MSTFHDLVEEALTLTLKEPRSFGPTEDWHFDFRSNGGRGHHQCRQRRSGSPLVGESYRLTSQQPGLGGQTASPSPNVANWEAAL